MTDRGFVLGWRQALVTGLLLSLGCSADDAGPGDAGGSNCEGAKCDEVEDGGEEVGACKDVLKDLSGRGLSVDEMLNLDDPISQLVLSQDGECSISVAAMARVLATECDDHRSALVSERSQRLGTFTDYRSVTMFDCGGEDVFLHYPILARELGDKPLSEHLENVEPAVIAQTASGVFNYYQSTGNDIRFFGSSLDMLEGTDLETLGEKVHGEEQDFRESFSIERSCAACHPGGGLLMKELDAPWLHWEPDFFSPSADDLISSADDIMGFQTDAIDLEGTVLDGNDDVNRTRIEHVTAGLGQDFDVGDLLRPLFCTDEFNTGSGFDDRVDFISFGDAVVDNNFPSPFFDVDNDTYQQILEDRGSRVETEKLGAPRFSETVGGLTFIHRARIDEDYIRKLEREEIIDRELVNDIRLIDFTRSVYSQERCDLIEIAAAVDPAVIGDGGRALSAAMVDVLEGKGSLSPAERDLLANLEQDDTSVDDLLRPFSDACESRNGRGNTDELLEDYVAYVAQVRKRAADHQAGDPSFMQFRFPGVAGFSFPVDDQASVEGLRFHPQTCEMTDEYIPLTDGQGGGGDPGDDADPPDDVDDGDCCVTCTTSQACGNGCISKSFMCHQEPGCACQG